MRSQVGHCVDLDPRRDASKRRDGIEADRPGVGERLGHIVDDAARDPVPPQEVDPGGRGRERSRASNAPTSASRFVTRSPLVAKLASSASDSTPNDRQSVRNCPSLPTAITMGPSDVANVS